MGSGRGVVGEPWPAAGRLPGRGLREERGIWVWAEASRGALGQFVAVAGTKQKSESWRRIRDRPSSDWNPDTPRTKLFRIKKSRTLRYPASLGFEKVLLHRCRRVSRMKGRGFWLKAPIYTVQPICSGEVGDSIPERETILQSCSSVLSTEVVQVEPVIIRKPIDTFNDKLNEKRN